MNTLSNTPFRVRWSSERGDRQQRNDPDKLASSEQRLHSINDSGRFRHRTKDAFWTFRIARHHSKENGAPSERIREVHRRRGRRRRQDVRRFGRDDRLWRQSSRMRGGRQSIPSTPFDDV